MSEQMEFTGERFVPSRELMNDEIAFEHLHRYYTALELVKGKVVLDIACGEGYGSAILSANADKVFGIDIDANTINHAKKKYDKDNIEFLCGSADNIPLADNLIDVIISYETIEHLDEEAQKNFLADVKRVLKKDGILVISTPDKANYTDRFSYTNEFHVKEFEKEEFILLLKKYFTHIRLFLQGYEIIDAITEETPDSIRELAVVNWQRETKLFSRKYLIAICCDIHKTDFHFSSAVFQVNKNYLGLMEDFMDKEAHIVELGSWGHTLDKEINEKKALIQSQQQTIEKQGVTMENLLLHEAERTKLVQGLEERLDRAEERVSLLKAKVEEYLSAIQTLEKVNNDKETTIQQQKEKEYSLYNQIENINRRLNEIYESDGWKFLNIYYKLKGKIIPEHSKRYQFLKKTFNKLRGKDKVPVAEKVITSKFSHVSLPQTFNILEFHSFGNPDVSIIIPVFNGWAMTYKCLKSILENTISTTFEIIIADDGATDETKNIKEYVKNITVIRNDKNLGFLDNCNNASTYAKGKFVLFLNNDTEVKPGWLSNLVDLMEKDELIGMAGSKFIYPDGKLQEAGGIIWNDASGWNFGHKQSPDLPEFNYVKEADYISGACILIRTDLWKRIGGFDRRYAPAYCEDSDLAFEVRKRGFKVIYQPLSEVIHYEGFSHGTDETGATIKAYQKLNNEKFREKWNETLLKEHFENGQNVFSARDRSRYKKTILVIDHYVPHFDKDAGSKTVFQFLKLFVSMNFNVKFMGDNFSRHEPYTTILQQMGVEVLFGQWYANNWQEWIKTNQDKLDFVLLNRPHISIKYIDFIKENTRAKVLYYGHDLHFMRTLKQNEIDNKKGLQEEAEKWRQIEFSLFDKSDLVLAPSEAEKSLIRQMEISTPIYAIKPYSFDIIPDPVSDFSVRKDILFVGGFTHIPNVDAVIWFVREVWPKMRNKLSGGRFIVAGSNVPPEIAALATEDINVVGFLPEPDLQKLYKTIKLVVVPLRYGAGVKGKTVEAMYHGIPLVTTSFGIEGLPGDTSFISPQNNATDFSSELIRLYNAPDEELATLSNKETDYVKEHFHFNVVKAEMIGILEKLKHK